MALATAENKVTERRKLQYELFGTDLLELCLDLRMALNGSADPWPEQDVAEAVDALRRAAATWLPSDRPAEQEIDCAVLFLVLATIRYACLKESKD